MGFYPCCLLVSDLHRKQWYRRSIPYEKYKLYRILSSVFHCPLSQIFHAAETCVSSYALQRSTFFEEARIKAKIPFLHHQVLECDSSGQEFNIIEHDTTVEIPKGAVSEGEKLCLEVGVAMYGPFKFTDDSQPISPILWLCFLNEDVKVNKPIKITVPHFLTGLTESRLQEHRVSFAKANHKDYIPQEDYIVYNFEPSEDTKTQFISRNDKSYGVLETTHCCYLCIKAKRTPLLAQDATYCLTRVERITSRGIEIHFAATYLLDTCIEVCIYTVASSPGHTHFQCCV